MHEITAHSASRKKGSDTPTTACNHTMKPLPRQKQEGRMQGAIQMQHASSMHLASTCICSTAACQLQHD